MMTPAPSSTTALDAVLVDLERLSARLDALVAAQDEVAWRAPTPAAGWDVATQIAHLMWTDLAAVHASAAADGRPTDWDELVTRALAHPDGFVDAEAIGAGAGDPTALLVRWREGRTHLSTALRALATRTPAARLPWFGPPMSPTSMATARYMETWAHGLDVHDAHGLEPQHDDGVRHVCHLGVRTRGFAYANRGLDAPTAPLAVVLAAPSGATWTFGDADAEQRVEGSAVDFARLVTQRRHRDDLALSATGAEADAWLDIAQAFAGPPGAGRPRERTTAGTAADRNGTTNGGAG